MRCGLISAVFLRERNFRFFTLILIIALLAGLSGCAFVPWDRDFVSPGDTAPPTPAAGERGSSAELDIHAPVDVVPDGDIAYVNPYERYEIPWDDFTWSIEGNNAWVIDRDGHTIPEDQQFEVLYDVLSREPQCLTLTKNEAVGKGWGDTIMREFSSLYDLGGNLLYDWDAYTYRAGFGDFIVWQNSMEISAMDAPWADSFSELWDFRQNRSLMARVWQAERLSVGKVLLSNQQGCPLAIVDGEGLVLAENSNMGYYSARVWNGFVIAAYATSDEGEYGEVLLSPEFAPLFTHDRLRTGAAKRALLYEDDAGDFGSDTERSGIVTFEGEEIFDIPSGQTCIYFDDELIVLADGWGNYATQYRIVRMADGAVLGESSGAFGYNTDTQNDIRHECFAVYGDGMMYLLDRDGKAFAQREIPDVTNIDYLGDGFFQVFTEKISGYYENSVFDAELNEIISGGVYENMYRADSWVGDKRVYYEIFVCSRREGAGDVLHYDIVDDSGNVLISGLSEVYDAGQNRLAVRKGFDEGLMDWGGNWIVKRSIFSGLRD